ncbi:hypothetical protein C8R47DRAFT_1140504 [Mycena vitilis]|nr:hypothetical protein C8R47DRAFT_1140504 [Mycena vitilis]
MLDFMFAVTHPAHWSCTTDWLWVHWPAYSSMIQQDTTPHARAAHLKKLPAYWIRLAADDKLPGTLGEELRRIVRYPATVQTLKGFFSAGVGKSVRYGAAKVGKWWTGSSSEQQV